MVKVIQKVAKSRKTGEGCKTDFKYCVTAVKNTFFGVKWSIILGETFRSVNSLLRKFCEWVSRSFYELKFSWQEASSEFLNLVQPVFFTIFDFWLKFCVFCRFGFEFSELLNFQILLCLFSKLDISPLPLSVSIFSHFYHFSRKSFFFFFSKSVYFGTSLTWANSPENRRKNIVKDLIKMSSCPKGILIYWCRKKTFAYIYTN